MNALIRKEFRLLMPAWMASLVLAIIPAWLYPVHAFDDWDRGVAGVSCLALFALGTILLGVAPFGQECSLGTLSAMLAQPAPRLRIWRTKVTVLAVSLFVAFGALLVSYRIRTGVPFSGDVLHDMFMVGGLSMLVASTGGLWTALLFRQVAAAFWLTLLIPAAIMVSLDFIVHSLRQAGLFHPPSLIIPCSIYALYSMAGFALARWMFFRAQDVPWTGGEVTLPARLGFPTRAHSLTAAPRCRPLLALARKELQSHHISLLLAALLALLHLVVIVIRRMEYDSSDPNRMLSMVLEFWWILWLALPLVIGATAVAEERKQGTLESQLCLQAARGTKYLVKFGIVILLGTFLGGVMPALLEHLGDMIGGHSMLFDPESFGGMPRGVFAVYPPQHANPGMWMPVGQFLGIAAAITAVAFYASTLTRNLLQAIGTGIFISGVLFVFWGWTITGGYLGLNIGFLWHGRLIAYTAVPVPFVVFLSSGFRNYKVLSPGRRMWLHNLGGFAGSMALVVIATALIYNRAWELVMPLEPQHGTAQISGPIRPAICVVGFKTFVLLPDGRLWATKDSRVQETSAHISFESTNDEIHFEKLRVAVPATGMFLDGSNWVSLACAFNPAVHETNRWAKLQLVGVNWISSYNQVVGVQADGTLWNIYTRSCTNLSVVAEPERIGTDSDWQAVSGGGYHFLALKRDGTLWGWGDNYSGQLGAETNLLRTAIGPIRVGNDSDWAAAFASGGASMGVKRDGSVWRWGALYLRRSPATPGGVDWTWEAHPKPVRWDLDGKAWVAFIRLGSQTYLAVERDGTLWADGFVPIRALDPSSGSVNLFSGKPLRVGHADWADIAVCNRDVVGLKRKGSLLQSLFYSEPATAFWKLTWSPSKYIDWIALQALDGDKYVAIAADGTLSTWGDPNAEFGGYQSLLGPSRKPLWSANIFAEAK